MKKLKSILIRIISVLSAILLLLSFSGCSILGSLIGGGGFEFSFSSSSASSPVVTEEPLSAYLTESEKELIDKTAGSFGFDYLSKLSSPESRKAFYKQLSEYCAAFHYGDKTAGYSMKCETNKEFYDQMKDDIKGNGCAVAYELQVTGLSGDEASETLALFKTDHPLYYWIPNYSVYYSSDSTGLIFPLLCLSDYSSPEERAALNTMIEAELDSLSSGTSELGSKYGSALFAHNMIVDRIDYKMNGDVPSNDRSAHTIVGYLDRTGCVCDGFSATMALFMNYLNIECITVVNLDHSWNMIKLDDGEWYWVDVTYDDNGGDATTLFFAKNDTEDIFAGTKYIGSGNFIENKHELLPPGNKNTKTPDGRSYGSLGIVIQPELPERSGSPYYGPKS